MKPTVDQLRELYYKADQLSGWDFSDLSYVVEGKLWDFSTEFNKRVRSSDVVLDIGTGGGERAIEIAPAVLLLVGIDRAAEMVETARENLSSSRRRNVRFFKMRAEDLQFPRGFFDLVSSRHCTFDGTEVARVLAKGGLFFTQQVGVGDKDNVKTVFGRGQLFDREEGGLRKDCLKDLRDAGFKELKWREYDAKEYYESVEDIVFLLKHTPIIQDPPFGEKKGDFHKLSRFIQIYDTKKGIVTNSKRFIVSGRKE